MNRFQEWRNGRFERREAKQHEREAARIALEASGLLGYIRGTKPAPIVRPPSVVERLQQQEEFTIPLFDAELVQADASIPSIEEPR